MKVNFREANSRNEWMYESDGICMNGYYDDKYGYDPDDCDYDEDEEYQAECPSDYEYPKVTVCFHDLTDILYQEKRTERHDATMKLWFNSIHAYDGKEPDDDFGIHGDYSNCTILTYDEYNEYIKLIQDFIPKFDYQLIKGEDDDLSNGNIKKHQIIIDFHQVNYVEFLFIATLIRYGYEVPSSPCMKDVLKLYHVLEGKVNIVNCVNVVLGMNHATHGHQTQCIYPHLSGVPDLMLRKNVLNRLQLVYKLTQTFLPLYKRNLEPERINWTFLVVDLEVFEKTQSQRMSKYLNFINKWRSVYTV